MIVLDPAITEVVLEEQEPPYVMVPASEDENVKSVEIVKSHIYDGHPFSIFQTRLLLQFKPNGNVDLGIDERRGFTVKIKNKGVYYFSIKNPRQAKSSQSWFDNDENFNNPTEILSIKKILTIKH
mgnify:CR=1 FL=1